MEKGIRERRKQLGLRQMDIAVACNVGLSTVQKWDKGTYTAMKKENAEALAKCLKLRKKETLAVWKYNRK